MARRLGRLRASNGGSSRERRPWAGERAGDPALAQRIEEAEPYTRKSRRSRVRRLRMIIRNGRGKDALAIIAKSRNVDAETRKRADDLLARA